jgi:hypothetical protein
MTGPQTPLSPPEVTVAELVDDPYRGGLTVLTLPR